MAVNYNPKTVTDGLVLHLDAGNKKSYPGSGTTWYDLSGNNNTGTLSGGIVFNTNNNGVLTFNGTSGYVYGNINNFSNGASYTTITWTKLTNSSREQHLTNLRGTINNGVQFYVIGSKLGTSSYGNLFGGSINANTWYMLVNVRDSSGSAAHYINGILAVSGSLVSYGNASTYRIANFVGGGNYYLGGDISVSQIYNRVLSASEITQNFNALRGRYGI